MVLILCSKDVYSKKILKLFGKSTYISFLRKSNNNFTKDYIENISYKYKGLNPLFFVKKIIKLKYMTFFIMKLKRLKIYQENMDV